jgi:hypothetical protein
VGAQSAVRPGRGDQHLHRVQSGLSGSRVRQEVGVVSAQPPGPRTRRCWCCRRRGAPAPWPSSARVRPDWPRRSAPPSVAIG